MAGPVTLVLLLLGLGLVLWLWILHGTLTDLCHTLRLQGATLMSKIDDLRAQLDRANTALANVADDIRRLTEQISTDLTPAEVEEIQQKLTSHANALQAVADQTPEPAPPAPPAEPVQ